MGRQEKATENLRKMFARRKLFHRTIFAEGAAFVSVLLVLCKLPTYPLVSKLQKVVQRKAQTHFVT